MTTSLPEESPSDEGMQSDTASSGPAEAASAAPQTTDDFYLVRQDEARSIEPSEGVLSNDFDPDADMLTAAALEDFTTFAGATVMLRSDKAFPTPPPNVGGGECLCARGYERVQCRGERESPRHRAFYSSILSSTSAGVGGFALDGQPKATTQGIR